MKISLSAVGKMYIVAAILRNALTCMYINSTSEYFALNPLTIHGYVAWLGTQNAQYLILSLKSSLCESKSLNMKLI